MALKWVYKNYAKLGRVYRKYYYKMKKVSSSLLNETFKLLADKFVNRLIINGLYFDWEKIGKISIFILNCSRDYDARL